ncbi:HEPN domain-containing protein [Breznakiellaceae bacterium SP9]
MDRAEEAKELFTIAEADLSSAQILMEKHWPTPDNLICNLCQQAGEKFLKGIRFEKIHNLVILLKLCETAESEFATLQDKCSYLTPFAVIPRYSYEQ